MTPSWRATKLSCVTAALESVQVFPATVTIINRSHADLSISGPSGAVAEGASATFTVTLSAACF